MNRKRILFKLDKIPQVIARIKSEVKTPKGKEDCWTWIGVEHRGQALMLIDGSYYNVRRVIAYSMLGIDVERCRFIYTTCGNPLCVNPAHLVPIMEGPLNDSIDGIKKILLSRKEISKDTDCWDWTGNINLSGYGYLWINRKEFTAHRLSAMVFLGFDIESELCVLHKCDNPKCINPEHLRIGTRSDNIHDMYSKGRQAILRGEDASGAQMTNDEVLEIRKERREGKTTVSIGEKHGRSPAYISQIVTGRKWSHLPGIIDALPRRIATPEEKDEIYQRWKAGKSQKSLSKEFGIGEKQVGKICRELAMTYH